MAIRYLDQPSTTSKIRFLDEEPAPAPVAQGSRESGYDRFLNATQGPANFINELSGLGTLSRGLGDVIAGEATDVTPRQALGSGLQGIVTIGSLAAAPAATLKGRALQAAGIGAASSAGRSIEKSASLGDAIKNAALAAGTGAAITGGTDLAGKILQGTGKKIYNTLIPTPTSQVKAGREKIGEGLLKRNIRGGYGRMQDTLAKTQSKAGATQQGILAKNAAKVDLNETRGALQSLRDQLANTPGSTTDAVDAVLKDIPESMSLKEAQMLKQNLQAAVNTKFMSENVVGTKQAQKTAAQGVRRAIEQAVPDIAEPNANLEFSKRASDALMGAANQKPNVLRNLIELSIAGGGYLFNPAISAAIGAERAITTMPAVGTRVGSAAYKAGQKALDPKVQAVLGRLVGQLTGRNQ